MRLSVKRAFIPNILFPFFGFRPCLPFTRGGGKWYKLLFIFILTIRPTLQAMALAISWKVA
jgi:hypothetical protein